MPIFLGKVKIDLWGGNADQKMGSPKLHFYFECTFRRLFSLRKFLLNVGASFFFGRFRFRVLLWHFSRTEILSKLFRNGVEKWFFVRISARSIDWRPSRALTGPKKNFFPWQLFFQLPHFMSARGANVVYHNGGYQKMTKFFDRKNSHLSLLRKFLGFPWKNGPKNRRSRLQKNDVL